jgi:DNA-directed RNA polymerase I, II, and III subunit RPABC2
MPPKKGSQKATKKVEKVTKKVNFKSTDEESNILINAPEKENYPDKGDLNLDETELETEIEQETEKDETEDQEDNQDDINEDHELDDEIEYDEEPVLEENEIDDLYEDGVKLKKKPKNKKKNEEDDEIVKLEDEECEYNYDEIYDEKKEEPRVTVENSERITLPKLTKYERVRLIGTRAKQISLGAKVMIKNTTGLNPIEIAKLELEHKIIPMKIKRVLPDNKVEIWKLSELDIDN